MSKGKLTKFFPGGNTSQGFYSFYDHIISQEALRIFVIKGGPGVGKSTLMRSVGEAMLDKGFDVEYHCCSSDNGSLDGVHIPKLGIAFIDGTAPHIVDPKNPGAVDTIIHLGDFWNEAKMLENKQNVLQTNRRVGRLFQMAYASLKEAKAIQEEWESYVSEATDFMKVNEITGYLLQEIFSGQTPNFKVPVKHRHLFASAITPGGSVNYLDTVLQDVEKLYIIKGAPGTGKSTLIGKIASYAETMGFSTGQYHCSFTPQKLDCVVVPSLKTAVVTVAPPVEFDYSSLTLKDKEEFDLNNCVTVDKLIQYGDSVDFCQEKFEEFFDRAVNFLRQAKAEHDKLETFYVPAMDFEAVNTKRDEILARVLASAEKQMVLEQ